MKQRLFRQQLSVSHRHLHFRFHLSHRSSHRRPNWARLKRLPGPRSNYNLSTSKRSELQDQKSTSQVPSVVGHSECLFGKGAAVA